MADNKNCETMPKYCPQPANPHPKTMLLNLPATLPIARYRYTFTITRTLQSPAYIGSALRGAFGHALRRASVPRGHRPEPELLQHTPYTHIFEPAPRPDIGLANPATIPPPYSIEPARLDDRRDYPPGSAYQLSLVLIGRARHYLPLISYAWQQAFRTAEGIARGQGELAAIAIEREDGWQELYDGERIAEHDNHITLPDTVPDRLTLRLLTPLRLQHNGVALGVERIDAQTLLTQLQRRRSPHKSTLASPRRPTTSPSKIRRHKWQATKTCAGTTGNATPTANSATCTWAASSATGNWRDSPLNTPAPCKSANGCTWAKTPPSASAATP